MYMGSAYDYFYGFHHPARGVVGAVLSLLEALSGRYTLTMIFGCLGTLALILAITNWEK